MLTAFTPPKLGDPTLLCTSPPNAAENLSRDATPATLWRPGAASITQSWVTIGVVCGPARLRACWGFYSSWCAGYAPFYGGPYFHRFGAYNGAFGYGARYGLPTNYGRVTEEDYLQADSAAAVLAPAVFMVVVGDSVAVERVGSTVAGEVEAATTSIWIYSVIPGASNDSACPSRWRSLLLR